MHLQRRLVWSCTPFVGDHKQRQSGNQSQSALMLVRTSKPVQVKINVAVLGIKPLEPKQRACITPLGQYKKAR